MFVALVRAYVLSGMGLSLKAELLRQPHATYHYNCVIQTSKSKNTDCYHNLKNKEYLLTSAMRHPARTCDN